MGQKCCSLLSGRGEGSYAPQVDVLPVQPATSMQPPRPQPYPGYAGPHPPGPSYGQPSPSYAPPYTAHGKVPYAPLQLTSGSGRGRLPKQNGNFDWIRKSNGPDDRAKRKEAADLTVAACAAGCYTLDGRSVYMRHVPDMVSRTRFVHAGDCVGPGPLQQAPKCVRHPPGQLMSVAVECARSGMRVALVNAASGYHVGGGFLTGGRHALEESLCTQSTLLSSLRAASESSWGGGATANSYIPTDAAVLSPGVEVFRGGTNDGYEFWPQAEYLAAVVSIAMPNCNPDVRDAPVDVPPSRDDYFALLAHKFAAVLAAAALVNATCLVVPDIGCGVYGNKPADIGTAFGEAIRWRYPRQFAEIHLVGQRDFADAAEAAGCSS